MTILQIGVGLFILGLAVLRPFLYKPVAEKYEASFSSVFFCLWMILGILVSFVFMGEELVLLKEIIKNNSFAFLGGVLKGAFVWAAVLTSQVINKKSVSSSVFFPFISLSLASIVLNLFFGENLEIVHLISIILLGVLGGVFLVFGDAKRMSLSEKGMFWLAVFFTSGCSVCDHIGIKGMGWYLYLVVSNVVMFLFVLIKGISREDIKAVFGQKEVVKAGFFTLCYESVIIASMIAVMPVSIASFFMRLSAPVVMIFSAIKFREQTVKNQLIFGGLAIILALPMMFVAK